MDYRDELSAELPTPRDDDPAGLRQDIVDELADHLTYAYNRELLRGTKSEEARQRVLERFGDPAALARRLWLEAIGGKIMAQRVLIATCLVVSLVSLALAGAMWQQVNRAQGESGRAAVEAIRALNAQNVRAEAGQQEMLKQLREMSEAIKSTRSFDWNPVNFKLTEETEDGPPAVGFSITLSAQAQNGVAMSPRVTDGQGKAEFVGVRPGQYFFAISKRWDGGSASTGGSLIVEPGSQNKKTLVCPKIPIERVPVRVRAAWPPDLEKQGLVLFAAFALVPFRRDDTYWHYQGESTWTIASLPAFSRSVLYGPGKSVAEVLDNRGPYKWMSEEPIEFRADLLTSALRRLSDLDEAMSWERGTYLLSELMVLRPRESVDGEGLRHFELVASASPPGTQPQSSRSFNDSWKFMAPNTPPTEAVFKETPRGSGGMMAVRVDLPGEYWSEVKASFVASPGKTNEWTIPLPDELLTIIRGPREEAK